MRKWLSWKYYKRATSYWYWRVVRQSGTPESLAMGMAIGQFIGIVIPAGGQILIAVPLAFLFRANKFLAILGTCNSNNFTIPFLYPLQCYIGSLILGNPISFGAVKCEIKEIIHAQTWESILRLGSHIIIPFLLGGVIIGALIGVISYYVTLGLVVAYRRRRAMRLNEKLSALSVDRNP